MKGKRGSVWILTGLLLLAAALCLVMYNGMDSRQAGRKAQAAAAALEETMPPRVEAVTRQQAERDPAAELPDYILNPGMDMPSFEVEGWEYVGIVEIPALERKLPVISRWSYEALRVAPARYQGSVYRDDMILCAHNYRDHFGPIGSLAPGDSVTFTDVRGNVFRYEVTEIETLRPYQTEELASGQWDLTLFTCDLSAENRIVVRCRRLEARTESKK